MSNKFTVKQTAIPGWLFSTFTILYCEVFLHLWITPTIVPGRFLGILAFAVGFGGLLGLLLSFAGHKAPGKWITTVVMGLISAFYLVEFFVSDAYKTFMPFATLLSGAGGVARDFGDIVVTLVISNLWRIGLIMLPSIAYAVFAKPAQICWKTRVIALAIALAGYFAGYGIVQYVDLDAGRFRETYNFDAAIRSLGLNMGMGLDMFNSGRSQDVPDFNIQAQTVPQPQPKPQMQPQPSAPQEETVPAEEETTPVEYGDNVMNIDFDALISASPHSSEAKVHAYVSSLAPTKKNAYTGLFEGKNLILITAEAFTKQVIDPELTPTLYRLANEGIQFEDYYQPAWGGSTTGGEYSNLVGLVPTNAGECMQEAKQQKLFLTMGYQLSKLGYYSIAYHNHNFDFYNRNETHANLGYEKFLAQYGGLEGITAVFPESDLEMIDVTVPQYIDNQPFNIYYMSVSGHSVYTRKNAMAKKNYDVVADMDASEPVKCYYAANMELEYAMASLIRQLENAGIADDTVIVISPDHYPYGLEQSNTWDNAKDYLAELYGVEKYDKFTRDQHALIIWSGSIEDMDIVVDTPVYSLDMLPTVSNLFGVEYDSRLLIGRDVFSDAQPLVLWPDHSWKTECGTYDSVSGVFTPNEGYAEDPAYIEYISSLVSNKITFSASVQNLDYYDSLLSQVE